MIEIFKSEKIPYFLIALFTIISLQFNYLVDSVLKIPVIEYKFETKKFTKNDTLVQKSLVIRNISPDKLIQNLHIQLRFESHSKSRLLNPEIDPIPPASIIQKDPKYVEDKLLYYPIQVIQPGLAYELTYYTDEKFNNPIILFECEQPIRLSNQSMFTFIIKNHIKMNALLMILFIFFSIIYIIKLK